MARRFLIPVLVSASAMALGLLTMAPSFAGTRPPVEPLEPTTSTVAPTPNPVPPTTTPQPTSTITWSDDLPVSIKPSKPDPLRDPTQPPGPIGSCANCLGDPNP